MGHIMRIIEMFRGDNVRYDLLQTLALKMVHSVRLKQDINNDFNQANANGTIISNASSF